MPIRPVAVPIRAPEAVASFEIAGVRYNEILKLRVHRDLQTYTGEGEVTLSWPGASGAAITAEGVMPMPAFMDGVSGTIFLDGQLAMTFRFDTRTSHGSPTQYELELHFRGLAADEVDGAVDHETGQEDNKTPGEIVKSLLKGYAAQLVDKSGESRKTTRFIIAQGETVERAVRRITREFGLNVYENEHGQVVMMDKDHDEGTGGELELGDRKITHWSVKRDVGPRAGQYSSVGNAIPTDEKYGKVAEIIGSKTMADGFSFQKLRTILVDGDHDQSTIKDRAGYEANRSSAQGLNVTLRVSTWTDVDGVLWTLNKVYPVTIPVDGVDEALLLSSVTFVLTPTERYATLVLSSKSSLGRVGDVIPTTGVNSMTEHFEIPVPVPPEKEKKKEEEPPPDGG